MDLIITLLYEPRNASNLTLLFPSIKTQPSLQIDNNQTSPVSKTATDRLNTTQVRKIANMKFLVALVLALGVAAVCAEPPAAEYGAPSSGYGAPSGGYGGGGSGGWGSESSSGGGWGSESSGGFLKALQALRPRFRYVNVRIPIPILPRIRLNLGARVNAHASIQQPQKGW